MGGGTGRKNLKRAAGAGNKEKLRLEDGHSIVQVLSLLGSNSIEVIDAQGRKSLALFPAKFKKLLWIKPGNFVVVDESGKEKAIESGSKVTSIVSQVLFNEQVRVLQKSPDWPEIFKSKTLDDTNGNLHENSSKEEVNELNSSDDDELPPLEANLNRVKPIELQSDTESDSESETDS